MKDSTENLLNKLRSRHLKVHKKYEDLFWVSYMGDYSVDKRKNVALKERDAFYADEKLKKEVEDAISNTKNRKQKESLQYWKNFFDLYQTPPKLLSLKEKISKIEDKMSQKVAKRKEGYIDPYTKKFVKASYLKIRTMSRTNEDQKIRKACFDAYEKLALTNIKDYVNYVALLNEYATGLGYEDFYDFKIQQEEGMTKKELFDIFDNIYEKTKYALTDIRKLEKKKGMKGLRKPWNYGYMMSGDFTKEEDQYFPFDQALDRWGRSFSALGIDFAGGKMQLDLLDRKGKYQNGFCHWPQLVSYNGDKLIPGSTNFTCNVVYGEPGSAAQGYNTLFHEGGHAAHFLNTEMKDTCLNHEYPPMSTAWAETQSMFLDTIYSSYAWKSRYAKNEKGETYPAELFERKVKKLNINRPLGLSYIIAICEFEKRIYEAKNLTENKIKSIAKSVMKKYVDFSEDSLMLLNVPHIYSYTSACSYQGYGLAEIALTQWREYFFKKYGYIVDNPNVGKEMKKVWKLGARHTFREFVVLATGKNLSPNAWIKDATKDVDQVMSTAKKEAKYLHEKIKKINQVNSVKFNSEIKMVSGKKTICTNSRGFNNMCESYRRWLNSL